MVGIPIDILNRLLSRIGAHLGGPGELSSAVNDAGFQYARPELAAIIEARDALQKRIRVVGHASAVRPLSDCDAGSTISQSASARSKSFIGDVHRQRHQRSTDHIPNDAVVHQDLWLVVISKIRGFKDSSECCWDRSDLSALRHRSSRSVASPLT